MDPIPDPLLLRKSVSLGFEAGTFGSVATEATEDKIEDIDSFYKELERVFDKFVKYHRKILLGDYSAKVGREDSKPKIWNESLRNY
jgi:hypothetical protein